MTMVVAAYKMKETGKLLTFYGEVTIVGFKPLMDTL